MIIFNIGMLFYNRTYEFYSKYLKINLISSTNKKY